MALTRSFKETIKTRVEKDIEFRQSIIVEAVQHMIDGDTETGQSLLRDYINATIGFERLAKETGKKPESLMRMFGRNGNPQAKNLFAVISVLGQLTGVQISVTGHHNTQDSQINQQIA